MWNFLQHYPKALSIWQGQDVYHFYWFHCSLGLVNLSTIWFDNSIIVLYKYSFMITIYWVQISYFIFLHLFKNLHELQKYHDFHYIINISSKSLFLRYCLYSTSHWCIMGAAPFNVLCYRPLYHGFAFSTNQMPP